MTAIPAVQPTGAHRGRRAANRRSGPPEDAPRWERPALAAVLVVAAVLYSWGIGHAALHPFYGAAIRSMAESWRAFFFGGLDASGSITIDKLPGAFWPDAVSVWLFGPHTWAAALPQVVEGVLTVWLLHRIVRAWAGPFAALIAALTLTLTPVTVALNRATIPDTALDLREVALFGIEALSALYPSQLLARYKLDALPALPMDALEMFGRKRGRLRAGGVVDLHAAAEDFVHAFRTGAFGPVSLERP